MKYRKRPIVIDAFQWFEGTPWVEGIVKSDRGFPACATLEGFLRVSSGDWIIKGIHGEFYPCKPDIFKKTYEMVEEGKK